MTCQVPHGPISRIERRTMSKAESTVRQIRPDRAADRFVARTAHSTEMSGSWLEGD
jgi:hypothetical protein